MTQHTILDRTIRTLAAKHAGKQHELRTWWLVWLQHHEGAQAEVRTEFARLWGERA